MGGRKVSDVENPPLVLMHCGWPGDRDLVGRLLGSMGIECLALEPETDLRRLVAEDRIDLVLADSSGGHGPLGDLLGTLDGLPEGRDLPLILLADPTDASMLADLTARRFHATLLKKPVEPAQLAAAVRAGLRYWQGRRENRRLMAQLEAAHVQSESRREEAEEAGRRYHDLVQGIELVIWESDTATRHFTFVSRRAEELFGQPAERWLTEPGLWLDRIVPEDREYAGSAWTHGLRDGRDFELEYRAIAGNGRTIWIREAVRIARDARGRTVGLRGLMWNITRKKKAERRLHTVKRLLAEGLDDMSYLHELSTRLSATLELEPMLEEVLAAVMSVQGAEMGLVRLVDRERGDLEIVASVGLPEAFLTRFGRIPPGVAACGMAIVRGVPILIEDVEADPCDAETREAGRIGGFRGDYSTPLVSRTGAMLGTIATFFRDPHRPSERQVRLVELYARQAADFVEAARLHRDLREADRRKDEFLAMLAHELRNPLAAILGEAQMLGEASDGPALAESREVILRQGRQMTRLVDDLLDASRIRRGDIPLRKVPLEVATEVARAVEAARPLIESRGHELTVSLPPEPLWLEADPVRLVQVLGNLLTNAAKYTEPGGRIALEAGREAGFLAVRVRDNGIGIAPEVLPKVFDLFAQADPTADRSHGGLGIGLALVQSLVERHGGCVSATSAGPGRGSEFVVFLPLAASPSEDQIPRVHLNGATDARSESRPKRVLVVDDQPDAARSLARLLKSWGHEVHVAHDGPEALQAALAHGPEVVLLDLGLPGMDGHEVASQLRGHDGRGPRIVALTGYGRDEDRRRSKEAGFVDHLVKPVDPDELRKSLGK